MAYLKFGQQAPDFNLPDHKGQLYQLTTLSQSQRVLLVFNLGFI